jgi:hypothetical protein
MQYNAKTVLRLIPNVTLARLFAPYSAFAGFAWDAGSKGSADRIFERWQTMEDGEVRAVGRILRQAHCLATPRGTRALIEAGRDQGLDLAEELAALGNAHERALACSLDHPEVFSAARILDGRRSRWRPASRRCEFSREANHGMLIWKRRASPIAGGSTRGSGQALSDSALVHAAPRAAAACRSAPGMPARTMPMRLSTREKLWADYSLVDLEIDTLCLQPPGAPCKAGCPTFYGEGFDGRRKSRSSSCRLSARFAVRLRVMFVELS